jgi:hypothetical protein
MRESAFYTVAVVGMLAGVTLFIAPGAQAVPLVGSALNPVVHQQTATQEVRCRGRRCYVSRPHYYVSRRSYGQPSKAWEYNPVNTQYYWGSGAMGGHGHR